MQQDAGLGGFGRGKEEKRCWKRERGGRLVGGGGGQWETAGALCLWLCLCSSGRNLGHAADQALGDSRPIL